MSLIRMERLPGDFFVAHKGYANDRNLTLEAKGVLTYLFSKPPNWECKVKNIIDSSKVGRDKVYRIIKELTEAHYIKRNQESFGDGKFGPVVYVVYESPTQNPLFKSQETVTASGFSVNGKSADTASGFSGSGPLVVTASGFSGSINNNEKENKNKGTEESVPVFACSQCRTSLQEEDIRLFDDPGFKDGGYCETCGDIIEILVSWKTHFPVGPDGKRIKPYHGIGTVRKKMVTRFKEKDEDGVPFKTNCLAAIEKAGNNLALRKKSWFNLKWLIANDEHIFRVLDGNYDDWDKDERKKELKSAGKGFDLAWTEITREISAVGANRKPRFTDPALLYVVDQVKWRKLCMSSEFDGKQAARAAWNNYQAGSVVVQAAAATPIAAPDFGI